MQLHPQACGILQHDGQRFIAIPKGGQAGQLWQAGGAAAVHHLQRGGSGAVGKFRLKKGRMVVPDAGAGPLLRQQIGMTARIVVGAGDGRRCVGAGTVVQMQQPPLGIRLHEIAGVGRVQGKQLVFHTNSPYKK